MKQAKKQEKAQPRFAGCAFLLVALMSLATIKDKAHSKYCFIRSHDPFSSKEELVFSSS